MKAFQRMRVAGALLVLLSGIVTWSCQRDPADDMGAAPGVPGQANPGGGGGGDSAGAASMGFGGASGSDAVDATPGGAPQGDGGAAAGASGASAGTGGATAGTGGAGPGATALVLSTPSITFLQVFCGENQSQTQSFTITNTSRSAIAWSGTSSRPAIFSIAPAGGTLAPDAVVEVKVAPLRVANSVAWQDYPTVKGTVSIVGDPAGTRTVAVSENLFGDAFTWSPASLDFGDVPIGSSKSLSITAGYGISTSGVVFGSSNAFVFEPSSLNYPNVYTWTVTFKPTALGPQSSTMALGSQFHSTVLACTPQTFPAKGTGTLVGAAGCFLSGAVPGTPCGDGKVCVLYGAMCSTELTLTGNPITFAPGVAFSGTIALGKDVVANAATMVAHIDWGDSTTSAGTINSSWQYVGSPGGPYIPLEVAGSHTYASSGTYSGTATITDTATGFSASAAFKASN